MLLPNQFGTREYTPQPNPLFCRNTITPPHGSTEVPLPGPKKQPGGRKGGARKGSSRGPGMSDTKKRKRTSQMALADLPVNVLS